MLPTSDLLRAQLRAVIADKDAQGHVVAGLDARLDALPDSYDALWSFALELRDLPLRPDWPYHEPSDLEGVWDACDPNRPSGAPCDLDPEDASRRVEAAWLGSVCGCILGKPLEVAATLAEIRAAAQAIGEWPLRDYVSERMRDGLGRLHRSWPETVRERIQYVAADDDLNYPILGMLLLEEHGARFTQLDVMRAWMRHLPPGWTFGPERTLLLKAGLHSLARGELPTPQELTDWVTILNPGDEKCGAMIRADAYGYACPGRPALAAELAWRDASWTHRRAGIYGTMFMAAAIATALVADHWHEVIRVALQFVPQGSRFHAHAVDCLGIVAAADDWLEAYEVIHTKYAAHGHCLIYQETGTLMNTLRFAKDVGDGICIQVMQGNDTDSYGARAGALLGAFFGPGHLDTRWLEPFHDTIHVGLADFAETSLSRLAARMSRLPGLVI